MGTKLRLIGSLGKAVLAGCLHVKSPWFFIENQIPNKDGTAFIVWDEFLDHEIKPIRWSDKIRDYASGEVEWSGSFLFWRYDDGTPAESPRSYQQS